MTVVVLYDGDLGGLSEGTTVTVYAVGKGQFDFPRTAGGALVQPVFHAQYVEVERR